MDLDATLVGLVLQGGDKAIRVAKEAGITPDIFLTSGQSAWEFIEGYRAEQGVFPSPGIVVEQTGLSLSPVDDGVTIGFVADKMHERAIFRILRDGYEEGERQLAEGAYLDSAQTVMDLAQRVQRQRAAKARVRTLAEVIPEARELYERTKRGEIGIPFPWPAMTDVTMGMWPGTLTFFVARPGVGKSWTVILIAMHAWTEGKKVLIVSPEMNRVELAERIVARHGQFHYGNMVGAKLGMFAEKKLYKVYEELEQSTGFYILDDEDRLEPGYIEEAVEAIDPDLIGIDSIYMLRVAKGKVKSGPGSRGGRYDRILDTVDWLRGFSKRTKKPVVGISQLSREGKVKKGQKRKIKKGQSTGGLEDALAMTDTILWDTHNLFAIFQDDDMKHDKQIMYVPLKARRQANWSAIVSRWDMDTMNFDQMGTRVEQKEDYDDEGFGDVAF